MKAKLNYLELVRISYLLQDKLSEKEKMKGSFRSQALNSIIENEAKNIKKMIRKISKMKEQFDFS